jgi:hypothetical protein
MESQNTKNPASSIKGEFDYIGYIKEGFDIVKSNPAPFILGNLALAIINSFAMGLLLGHWYAGMYYMVQKARKGETLTVGDAFWGLNNFIPNLVSGLIFSIGIGVGLMFCIIPGFIVGGILLYIIPLVAFENYAIGDAINTSKDEAMASLVNHSLFFLLITLITAAGFILCGVGVNFTNPVGIVAMAVAYEERFGK